MFQLKNDIFQRSLNSQTQQNELLHRTLAQDHHNNVSIHQSVQANNSSQLFNNVQQSPLQKPNVSIHNQSLAQSLGYGAVPKQDDLLSGSTQVRNPSFRVEPQAAAASNNFELWCSPSPQKPTNFSIYEQSALEIQPEMPPKGKCCIKVKCL